MNALEQQMLQELTEGVEPRLCFRTKTRIDAGRWWWRVPVWICAMQDELIVFAVAKRHYVQAVPFAACGESWYCHATGKLVIAPVEGLEFDKLAMSPASALKVLDLLNTENLNTQ
jgi:hypothetical protein